MPKVNLVRRLLEDLDLNPARLSLEWVSAAEGSRFVTLITEFTRRIQELGPLGSSEGLDPEILGLRLKAAKMALEGKKLRLVLARRAKAMKQGERYGPLPPEHKLNQDLEETLARERAAWGVLLSLRDKPRPLQEVAGLLGLSEEAVLAHFQRLEKKRLLEADRLLLAGQESR